MAMVMAMAMVLAIERSPICIYIFLAYAIPPTHKRSQSRLQGPRDHFGAAEKKGTFPADVRGGDLPLGRGVGGRKTSHTPSQGVGGVSCHGDGRGFLDTQFILSMVVISPTIRQVKPSEERHTKMMIPEMRTVMRKWRSQVSSASQPRSNNAYVCIPPACRPEFPSETRTL